jgi:hypothetical protein
MTSLPPMIEKPSIVAVGCCGTISFQSFESGFFGSTLKMRQRSACQSVIR